MFSRILVPLDGSEMAEEALAPAFQLAGHFQGLIILLRVVLREVAIVETPSPQLAFEADDSPSDYSDAQSYLDEVKQRWSNRAVNIQTQTHSGAPAEVIVKVAHDERVSLIVMSTHGRSGVSRLLYGSVAEAVLRGARTPMLLIPAV